jgi:hypothetical protein
MPRRELDFYETPPHYIAALLGEVNVFGTVFEPCVGEGAIADALRKVPAVGRICTNDIDQEWVADTHVDAREVDAWLGWIKPFDWVVTNPPFSDELPILEQALDYAPNVAFLARLSFLEPTEEREYFLEQHAPDQIIVLPRYSFRPNDAGKRQTDSVTCAWLVWYADHAPRRTAVWGRGKSQACAALREL